MKKITTLLLIAACLSMGFAANAGDNPTPLTAQKICGKGFDVFASKSMEDLLGLDGGRILSSYEVVLYVPADQEVYKYHVDGTGVWTFESLIRSMKGRAKPGSILFIDQAVTTDKQKVEQTGFYLR